MTKLTTEHGDELVAPIRLRHELCQALRQHLVGLGAVEVATPILQRYPDVAPTQQFTTVHPATGGSGFLRIAPTENLKRLIVAGLAHVFEFAVNFREDVADRTHLPEFTSLEVMARSARCADMEQMAIACCELAFQTAVRTVPTAMLPTWLKPAVATGRLSVTRLRLADELQRRFHLSRADLFEVEALRKILIQLQGNAAGDGRRDAASLMDHIVTTVASETGGAVLVTGFPQYLGGPATPDPSDPWFKQRSELFVGGVEVANMSSNLTDIEALRAWHERGVNAKAKLGITTNQLDEQLLADLAGGFPESAVIGIGIERLLLTFFGLQDMRELQRIYE